MGQGVEGWIVQHVTLGEQVGLLAGVPAAQIVRIAADDVLQQRRLIALFLQQLRFGLYVDALGLQGDAHRLEHWLQQLGLTGIGLGEQLERQSLATEQPTRSGRIERILAHAG